MTRETKIGLLVGLAFIIVIGILLSDHLSSSAEPPSATLAQVGTNVRQQVQTPAGSQQPVPQVTAPTIVVPTNPIATQRDLAPQTDASVAIKIGPATPTNSKPTVTGTPVEPPVTMVDGTSTKPEPKQIESSTGTTTELVDNDLTKVAMQHGEQLITPNGQPASGLPKPKAIVAAGNDYVIQPGDSLSKLASRFLGSNTKINRDLIIKANPTLAANPDKLVIGKSYKMPSAPNAAAASALFAPVAEAPVIAKTAPVELASSTETYYTVQPGDSLWRISSTQLGKGGSGVAAIKELNKDVLNGGETVTVDMKLRMPSKALASIN